MWVSRSGEAKLLLPVTAIHCSPQNSPLLWSAVWYCLGWTTSTLCCMVLQSAVFRSYSVSRTLWRGSSHSHQEGHMLYHCWNSYHTGFLFVNVSCGPSVVAELFVFFGWRQFCSVLWHVERNSVLSACRKPVLKISFWRRNLNRRNPAKQGTLHFVRVLKLVLLTWCLMWLWHRELCWHVQEEEKEKEREAKGDRVSDLKKDYNVSLTNSTDDTLPFVLSVKSDCMSLQTKLTAAIN